MTVPTSAPPMNPELPNIAVLPRDGDFICVLRVPSTDDYVALSLVPMRWLEEQEVGELIHYAPLLTDVPDDLIEQFKRDLGIEGDE